MTYNVLMGTLNPTHSLTHWLTMCQVLKLKVTVQTGCRWLLITYNSSECEVHCNLALPDYSALISGVKFSSWFHIAIIYLPTIKEYLRVEHGQCIMTISTLI